MVVGQVKRLLVVLLVWTMVAGGGCSKGPPTSELQTTLQQALDGEFRAGLFKVVSFRRMGCHTSLDPTSGESRLLVYFDAELEFQRPYSMADWNALGYEALIHAVGAGAKGIDGIVPEGNRVGDRLRIHGTLPFVPNGDGWARRGGEVRQATTEDDPRGGVLTSQYDDIRAMTAEIEGISQKAFRAKDSATVEFAHSLVRVTRNRLLKATERSPRTELVIASGHVANTYYPLCQALAEALTAGGVTARAQQTEGSVENCKMVHHGYVDLAVTQNDVAWQAHTGAGAFEGTPLDNIVALCAWYPEPVQICVLADGPCRRVEDLKGRTIVVGPRASGTKINALQVLQACGFGEADLGRLNEAPAAVGFDVLARGEADAVFLTEAFPARALRTVVKNQRVRLLSLSEGTIRQLVQYHPFFVPLTIPAHHCQGQDEDVQTVAVTAILVGSRQLSDEQVARVLELQYGAHELFIKAHPKGAAISRRFALEGMSIPLHPGAAAFFKAGSPKP